MLFASVLLSTIAFLAIRTHASAATITVVSGTDAINDNNQCQLSEAIQNINDQAQTNNDCPAGDGNNDTINLPAGTITLSADLPLIEESITIKGQSASQSIIDGNNGQYACINIGDQDGVQSLTVSDLTVRAYLSAAIVSHATFNVEISRVNIDGEGAEENVPEQGGSIGGILLVPPLRITLILNYLTYTYMIFPASREHFQLLVA